MKRFDLRQFRKEHKLTQAQLADILGCKQSFISSIEKGSGINSRGLPQNMYDNLTDKFGDISAYISNYEAEEVDDDIADNSYEESAYKSNITSKKGAYILMPKTILEELTKLTETIYSQQRTIECLVQNQKA